MTVYNVHIGGREMPLIIDDAPAESGGPSRVRAALTALASATETVSFSIPGPGGARNFGLSSAFMRELATERPESRLQRLQDAIASQYERAGGLPLPNELAREAAVRVLNQIQNMDPATLEGCNPTGTRIAIALSADGKTDNFTGSCFHAVPRAPTTSPVSSIDPPVNPLGAGIRRQNP